MCNKNILCQYHFKPSTLSSGVNSKIGAALSRYVNWLNFFFFAQKNAFFVMFECKTHSLRSHNRRDRNIFSTLFFLRFCARLSCGRFFVVIEQLQKFRVWSGEILQHMKKKKKRLID